MIWNRDEVKKQLRLNEDKLDSARMDANNTMENISSLISKNIHRSTDEVLECLEDNLTLFDIYVQRNESTKYFLTFVENRERTTELMSDFLNVLYELYGNEKEWHDDLKAISGSTLSNEKRWNKETKEYLDMDSRESTAVFLRDFTNVYDQTIEKIEERAGASINDFTMLSRDGLRSHGIVKTENGSISIRTNVIKRKNGDDDNNRTHFRVTFGALNKEYFS